MKASQIKRILSGLGYSENERNQFPEFKNLVFSTNHYLNYKEDFVNFNNTEGLIKIKRYRNKIINGRTNTNIKIEKNRIESNASIVSKSLQFKFRSPEVGDTIFIIKKDTVINTGLKIIGTGYNSITLDKDFTFDFDTFSHTICYMKEEDYKVSSRDPLNPTVFIKYSQVSENENDVILDSDMLIGIEGCSPGVGSY